MDYTVLHQDQSGRAHRYRQQHQWDHIIDEKRRLGWKDTRIQTYLQKQHSAELHRLTIRRTMEQQARNEYHGWVVEELEPSYTPLGELIPVGYTKAQERYEHLLLIYLDAETDTARQRLVPYIELAINKLEKQRMRKHGYYYQ